MPAGKLKHRIQLLARVAGQDAIGQPVDVWQTVATAWADVRFVSGIETIKAGRETSTGRVSVQIRRRDGVSAAMRMLIGADLYQVADVVPDRTGAYQTLIGERIT